MNLDYKQIYALKHCDQRFNLLEGSVRSGKSFVGNIMFLKYLLNAPKGNLFFSGYTAGTIYRNIITPLMGMVGNDIQFHSSGNTPHCTLWGRKIDIIGCNNSSAIGKIQGSEYAGGLSDEFTKHNKQAVDMLGTRLSVKGAKWFATTNPDNPRHWAMKEYIENEKISKTVVKFRLEDNTHLPEDYVEQIKAQYTGLFYKRYILGEWVVGEGAIYDMWQDKHIIPKDKIPQADYYTIGIDYGTANPTVFLLMGHKRNPSSIEYKCWIEKEYYYDGRAKQHNKTDLEYSNDLQDFIKEYTHGLRVQEIVVDPSAKSFITQLNNDRVGNVVYANNAVIDGIRTVSMYINSGQYGVSEDCEHLIEERGAYIWDEKAMLHGEDRPVKENDHCSDAERYLIMQKEKEYNQDFILGGF